MRCRAVLRSQELAADLSHLFGLGARSGERAYVPPAGLVRALTGEADMMGHAKCVCVWEMRSEISVVQSTCLSVLLHLWFMSTTVQWP